MSTVCVAVAFPALFALLGDLVGVAVLAVMAVVPWLLAVHDRRTALPHSVRLAVFPSLLTLPRRRPGYRRPKGA